MCVCLRSHITTSWNDIWIFIWVQSCWHSVKIARTWDLLVAVFPGWKCTWNELNASEWIFKLNCAESEQHFVSLRHWVHKKHFCWCSWNQGNVYLEAKASLCIERWWNGKLCQWNLAGSMCMWIGPVHVCVLYIFVHVCLRVRCECKLVVGCRPRCRLMVYGQVIYDLSVAGREGGGDTRLSPQINKHCS